MSCDWLGIWAVLVDSTGDGIVAATVAISAIVMGSSYAIVKSIIKHRERMARIGMGIDPDARSQADWTCR